MRTTMYSLSVMLSVVAIVVPVGKAWAGNKPFKPVKMEYRSFEDEKLPRFEWLGRRVAFLLFDYDSYATVMTKLCSTFDRVYDFYHATGQEPAKAKLYEGRLTVAEVEKDLWSRMWRLPVATRIELMPACFRELYDGVTKHNPVCQTEKLANRHRVIGLSPRNRRSDRCLGTPPY